MGKKVVTIYIPKGAKVGDVRKIGTPSGYTKGRVIKDLKDSIPEQIRTCGGKKKKLIPGKNYYRVELDN